MANKGRTDWSKIITDGNATAKRYNNGGANVGFRRTHSTDLDAEEHANGNESDAFVEKNWEKVGDANTEDVNGNTYQELYSDPINPRYRLFENETSSGILDKRNRKKTVSKTVKQYNYGKE